MMGTWKKWVFLATGFFVVLCLLYTSSSIGLVLPRSASKAFTSLVLSLTSKTQVVVHGERKLKQTNISEQRALGENQHAILASDGEQAIRCRGSKAGQAEDLFCMERPVTLKEYKNPCWKDKNQSLRCLPYFHLIGADKSGSTDLFSRIQQHPDVLNCTCRIQKESWYWSWNRYGFHNKRLTSNRSTFSEYIQQFDDAAKSIEMYAIDGFHYKIVGDGSPMDFWDFRGWKMIPQNQNQPRPKVLTPHLMRHMYGDKRLILIMRNPVDRLYSDYYFLGYGKSPDSFHYHVIKSIQMMNSCLKELNVPACFYSHSMYLALPSRIHLGCYSVFLEKWLSVFPKRNFLFLRTEDYQVDIAGTISDVYEFLDLRPLGGTEIDRIASLSRRHVTAAKKNAPPMFNSTRQLLTEFYAPYNKKLSKLLGDDRFLWMK